MKCFHCDSEWNVNPGLSITITVCPFCGKSLIPQKKSLETVEDVLIEIKRQFGISVLSDDSKLLAYFSDLAPQLSRHRRILGYFVECNGHKKLVSVMNSSENEQQICAKQLVREMKDVMFIDEEASHMICDAFLYAVSGLRLSDSDSALGVNATDPQHQQIIEPTYEDIPKVISLSQPANGGANGNHDDGVTAQFSNVDGSLSEAVRKIEGIHNPSGTVRLLIEQYRAILRTEGKYVQLHTHPYGPFYFSVEYYIRENTVYATIDYSGFAGAFADPGVVRCIGDSQKAVVIEAVGINEYTLKSHSFVFRIDGNMVDVTGSDGFGHQICKRIT